MNNTLKKIAIPLLLIVIIPAVSYSVYEIASLNETEKIMEEIYKNQLDVILNSVNQYSDLTVSSWVSEINSKLSGNNEVITQADVHEIFLKNKSVLQLFIITNLETFEGYSLKRQEGVQESIIKNIAESNRPKIERLYRYIEADYRKIEPLDSDLEQRQFLAVLLSKDEEEITAIFELNTSQFIEEILRPVILEAAGEEFAISCNATNDIHNFNFDETIEGKQAEVTSPLWLIPNYELGIILKGRTLGGLIAERTYTNLIIIILMTIVIVGGVIIIYRNIQKEIKLAQIKSDFVSNVSHELRTPLALISMYSETLELGRIKTEEKKAEYYKVISQESNRLSRIVNSILSFSKIESGKRHYNFQTVNLNDIVERVYENYKFHLENMGFTFNFIKEENLPRLNLDREAVTESIINLVDNAAKYSKENKFIELKTMMYKGKPTVEVIDKGIGIAKDDQRKIFEKFFRVSTGLVHDTKGTGLGLTIVKHVLDAHNAVIELDSQEGNGTTFRIIFSLNKIN